MKYQGSKRRILKDILPIILKERKEGQVFVEPFCGSAIISQNVDAPVIASDAHYYLVELLRAIQNGWKPPEHVSQDYYYYIRQIYKRLEGGLITYNENVRRHGEHIDAIIGFVGFCSSYSGKWFGGYARSKNSRGEPRNHADEQKRNLDKRAPLIQHIEFECSSYKNLTIPPSSLIYCDPPYAKTTKYKEVGRRRVIQEKSNIHNTHNAHVIQAPDKKGFSHEDFWTWCRERRDEGHTIFVSEYEAPDDMVCVWQKPLISSLTKNTGAKVGMEKLFIVP